MKEIILYHGSKGGIQGNIAPISRDKCDFGKGFYMGEHMLQAAGNAKGSGNKAVLYTLKVTVPDEAKVLRLTDDEWLYAILSCRRSVNTFNNLDIASYWRDKIEGYDLIIGKIADDEMNAAMREFSRNTLTDAGLKYCLSKVEYGDQYVAKTMFMCKNIKIIEETAISDDTFPDLDVYMRSQRASGQDIVEKAVTDYYGIGIRLVDIIKKESKVNG